MREQSEHLKTADLLLNRAKCITNNLQKKCQKRCELEKALYEKEKHFFLDLSKINRDHLSLKNISIQTNLEDIIKENPTNNEEFDPIAKEVSPFTENETELNIDLGTDSNEEVDSDKIPKLLTEISVDKSQACGNDLSTIIEVTETSNNSKKGSIEIEEDEELDIPEYNQPIKTKLSIQTLPAIDIRRELVTQRIPDVIITCAESIPEMVVNPNANIAYEIIKHTETQKITQKTNIRPESPKHAEASKVKRSSTATIGTQLSPDSVSASDVSSIPSYDYVFKRFNPVEIQAVKRSTETVVKLSQVPSKHPTPATQFCKPQVAEVRSKESSKVSNAKSYLTPCLKEDAAKDLINEIMKNPEAEVVFKSYQVLDENSGHDPEQIDVSELSFIDDDIYKTYVNPEGLKIAELVDPQQLNQSLFDSESIYEKQLFSRANLEADLPPEFYITKTNQYDEFMTNKKRYNSYEAPHEPIIRPETSTLSEMTLGKKNSARQSLRSSISIPRAVQDKLNAAQISKRNSKEGPRAQGTLYVQQDLFGNSKPELASIIGSREPSFLKFVLNTKPPATTNFANNLLNSQSADTTSIASTNTDDVIFEIDRNALRKSNVFERNRIKSTDVDDASLAPSIVSPVIPDVNSKAKSISNTILSVAKSDSGSVYVITQDAAIQTSNSEVIVKSLEYTQGDVPQRPKVPQQDNQEEKINCCAKLCKQKQTPSDFYQKSSNVDSVVEIPVQQMLFTSTENLILGVDPSFLDRRKSVKIEDPEITRKTGEVESFIAELTNCSTKDIETAKSAIPYDERRVFEKYNNVEIVDLIKKASDAFTGAKDNSQTGSTSSADEDDKEVAEMLTIMTVNVQTQPIQSEIKVEEKEEDSPDKNAPGGDTNNMQSSFEQAYDQPKSSRPHKYRHNQTPNHSESISENTEDALSEGEVKCKCDASVGERHTCPYLKTLYSRVNYVKTKPESLSKQEFTKTNIKIKGRKVFNSNWIAYFLKRSSSPDSDSTSNTFDDNSDSSGLINK